MTEGACIDWSVNQWKWRREQQGDAKGLSIRKFIKWKENKRDTTRIECVKWNWKSYDNLAKAGISE